MSNPAVELPLSSMTFTSNTDFAAAVASILRCRGELVQDASIGPWGAAGLVRRRYIGQDAGSNRRRLDSGFLLAKDPAKVVSQDTKKVAAESGNAVGRGALDTGKGVTRRSEEAARGIEKTGEETGRITKGAATKTGKGVKRIFDPKSTAEH